MQYIKTDSNITLQQYDEQLVLCRDIFVKKLQDYGMSWRVMRPRSFTDQLFIKAQRIRTLEDTGINKVGDGIEGEFIALVNYGLMALIQLENGISDDVDNTISGDAAVNLFNHHAREVRAIMLRKNHDYGEAWRDMRISSFIDLILTKILRIKQIENNEGKTLISEGLDGHYTDIINYAMFALIRLNYTNPTKA